MGKNWAIAIGINQYDNLKPLKYAQRDAAAVRELFRDRLQFEQIYYFTPDAPPIPQDYGPPIRATPTYTVLSRFLRVRFERKNFLNPEDNFWFFFAGHGKRYKGCDYLLPSDADPGNVERTALSIREIGDRLRRSGAGNVILLLDACRDEDDRAGQGIGLERQQGVVTFSACSPEELSYEIDDLQQGAFTHALLEGLNLQGVGNCATVDRLDHYLRDQVPRLNQRYGKPLQHPYMVPEPSQKRHLILLPKFAEPADIQTLKLDAFEAEAKGDWQEARHLWRRVLAVMPDAQAFEAIERIAIRSRGLTETPSEPALPTTDARVGIAPDIPATEPVLIQDQVDENKPEAEPVAKLIFEFETVRVDAKGEIVERQQRQAEYQREDLDKGVSLDLVWIPGGTFLMGSPEDEEGRDNERPQHKVTIPAFWMGKYPVTQAQWKVVSTLPKVNRDLEPDPSQFKGADRPVEQVTWFDAVEFCDRLSKHTGKEYRLPSEAEWEYACRAGTTTPFHFGETITTNLANYDGNYTYKNAPKGEYRRQTTPVGSFPPNAFGLYDLHGNVWEWCLDHWHDNYQNAPSDGSAWVTNGDSNYRLLRGGSWNFNPRHCRSAYRLRYRPDGRGSVIGFRVVCCSAWTLG